MKPTTVYLPDETHKALRIEAIQRSVTMTELVRELVEAHLRKVGYELGDRELTRRGRAPRVFKKRPGQK